MAHGKPLHALTEEHTAVGFNTDRVVINTHKIGSMDPALKSPAPARFEGQHYTKTGVTKKSQRYHETGELFKIHTKLIF